MPKRSTKASADSATDPSGEVDALSAGDGDESFLEDQRECDEAGEEVVEEERVQEIEVDEVEGKGGGGGSDLPGHHDDDTSKTHEGCCKEPMLLSSNSEKSSVNSINSQTEYLRGDNLGNDSPSKLHIKKISENNNGDLSQPTSQRRPRSSSPCVQNEHASKNPAIICDFFARGWCIKGSSCRFLHKKEVVGYVSQEIQEDKGTTEDSIYCKGNSTKSDFLLQRSLVRTYGGEVHGFSQFTSKNSEHFPVDGVRQTILLGKCPVTDVPVHHDCSNNFPDRRSASVEISSRHLSGMMYNEMPSGMHRYDASFSRESLIKNPLASESNYVVGGSSMPLNVHNDSCDIYSIRKKPDDLAREYQQSHFMLHDSYTSGLSGDSLSFSGLPQKLEENTWETSVPFRPSVSLAPFIKSYCDSQYDPFIDSIDHSKQVSPSASPKGTLGSSQSQHPVGAPIAGDSKSVYDATRSVNSFTSATVGILGTSKPMHECSINTTAISPGLTTNAEEKGQIPDLAIHPRVDKSELGDNSSIEKVKSARESKEMKIFHAALVDYLKKLLKPSWKEGRLNKDTHKLIAKKAAEKVLGALQPHQVPNGPDAIDQYLLSSRPKLLKLVEAYVDKYGRS
ncbi:protein FRIGIDA-ESSENTIAL 1-like [Zingiber officinale]|uniref:protein FRIGIDA-ESSENTIAL 1-like n=1 Tax=Zingiber officinale TaxID=94328 RepID=UPI001C4C69D3|nr:protein FRIGIDA-ESSENTIAL 1-like [Zingiber officinale]